VEFQPQFAGDVSARANQQDFGPFVVQEVGRVERDEQAALE
jgi:hypothetical protein